MSEHLLCEQRNGVLYLTFNNPGARNALGPALYDATAEALKQASSNDEVHCVVLSGAGGTFSAGGNLQRLLANRSKEPAVQEDSIDRLNRCTAAIGACTKPVIAAVEGFAAGAGFSIVLACDFIVAADNAKFVMSYVAVALTPDGGGTWDLARRLPRALVCEALLDAAPLGAARLAAIGLVNRVVLAGTALDSAAALAHSLAKRSPRALASIKNLIRQTSMLDRDAYLREEKSSFIEALRHADAGEGITAFLEKRPAIFSAH